MSILQGMGVDLSAKEFKSRDKNIVLILLSLDYRPSMVTRETVRETNVITFHFLMADVLDSVEKWFNNEPIPIPDIRSVIVALEIWNSYVRMAGDIRMRST